MSKHEEFSLIEALSTAKLPQLPEEYVASDGKVWVLAIVLVTKCNTKRNYAIAINDGDGSPMVIRDFGSVAQIVKIEHIYPYHYMTNMSTPNLRNKQEIICYLSNAGYSEDDVKYLLSTKDINNVDKTNEQKEADRNTVKKWVMQVAIKNEITRVENRIKIRNTQYYGQEGD